MQVWVEVSENGRDFVRQTLQVEPTLRLTAVEALRHQWMLATHQSPKRKQVCMCVWSFYVIEIVAPLVVPETSMH